MKKFIKVFMSLCAGFVFSLALGMCVDAQPYEYPIYPGTEEWKEESQNSAELREKLQIPENILIDMTTEELVDAVLDYPCFNELYFFDNMQTGFETMAETFNGVAELLNREDAGAILLSKYRVVSNDYDVNSVQDDFLESYKKICYKSNIEVLLAQQDIVDDFTPEETDALSDLTARNSMRASKNTNKITYKQNTYARILQDQQD